MLALLEEKRETCPSCGHPMSVCRDPRTAGTWQVVEEICQPSVITQAIQDNYAEAGTRKRGLHMYTRRTEGS